MILSRTLAKRRIATGERPGLVAAWGPVLFDGGVIVGVLAILAQPVMAMATAAGVTSFAGIAMLFFLLFFVPIQAVLIMSTIWAVKSRWEDSDGNPE